MDISLFQEVQYNFESFKKGQEDMQTKLKDTEAYVTSQVAAVEMSKHVLQSEKQVRCLKRKMWITVEDCCQLQIYATFNRDLTELE